MKQKLIVLSCKPNEEVDAASEYLEQGWTIKQIAISETAPNKQAVPKPNYQRDNIHVAILLEKED